MDENDFFSFVKSVSEHISSKTHKKFTKQADRKLFMIFFGVLLTLYYDYMCSETDFIQEKKSFSSNYKNPVKRIVVAAFLRIPPQILDQLAHLEKHVATYTT